MGTPKLLFSHLRRCRPLLSLSTLSHAHVSYQFTNSNPFHHQPPIFFFNSHGPSFAAFYFPNTRSFSSRSNDDDYGFFTDSSSDSKPTHFGVDDVGEGVVNGSTGGEESSLPVLTLISLLDGFHDLTGLPWWAVIASTTVAMRLMLFPLLVLQLKKLARISELFPKLPPPFPPPFSGRSFIDQISLFRRERREIGCPSYLWFCAFFSVQVPCFLLWITTIRKMSLDHHAGFDCGGTLWFQNLTEFPHGVLGPIFPLLIGGLHYINVQLSFEKILIQNRTGLLGLLAKYYKLYLDVLTMPLIFIGFCIPQGSLIYWVTNSSLTVIQQLSLKHPAVREKLGLPTKGSPTAAAHSKEMGIPGTSSLDSPIKEGEVYAENLNPKQLMALSAQLLSKEQRENAIVLLQVALQKDPNYVEALVLMGQALLQKGMYKEATEHLECAISKLCVAGHPTEVKDADLLILSSQWAGVACVRQGKNTEAILHFERVARIKEPEDPKSKVHYFNTLVYLASALDNAGRKAEAIKYLRLAVAYDPSLEELLEQYENGEEDFGSDLINSRRKDY